MGNSHLIQWVLRQKISDIIMGGWEGYRCQKCKKMSENMNIIYKESQNTNIRIA